MLTVKTKKANDDNDDQEKEGNDDNDDEVAVEEEAAWLEACHKTNYRGPALYTHHTMHCNAMYVKTYHKLHCYVCQNIYSKQIIQCPLHTYWDYFLHILLCSDAL